MKRDLLNVALNQISDEYIYDAKFNASEKIIKFSPKKYISAAACFLLILLMIPALIFANNRFEFWYEQNNSSHTISENSSVSEEVVSSESSQISSTTSKKNTSSRKNTSSKAQGTSSKAEAPIFNGIYYTAKDISYVFGRMKSSGTATTAYKKVYVTKPEYLYIDPLPKDKYLNIYHTAAKLEFNKDEFVKFTNKYFGKIAAATGNQFPEYTINLNGTGYYTSVRVEDGYSISPLGARQYGGYNTIYYWDHKLDNGGKNNLVFDGVTVMIDQTQSDTQIKESLQPLKSRFEKAFGVDFPNVTVRRTFTDSDSDMGASGIYVTFSNSEDEKVDKFIEVYFDNHSNHISEILSKDKLYNVTLSYYEEIGEYTADEVAVARVKKLSLKKAEEYLSKGYVFGGYSCPICQSRQDPIDFTEYDYVDIEYITSADSNDDGTYDIIPFYAFYKYIGLVQNGNKTYAKTYVPAIEVSGLEEYFKEEHKRHNTSSTSSQKPNSSTQSTPPKKSSSNASSTESEINSSFVLGTESINKNPADTSTALQSEVT